MAAGCARRPDAIRRLIRLPAQAVERLQELDLEPDPARPAGLVPPKVATLELSFTVRRADVDLTGHTNNTGFAEWAMKAVPDEVRRCMG
jgi:acyl-ACP thioesterase